MVRRFFLLIVWLFVTVGAMAQRQGVKNIPYIDQRRLHYGFQLGLDANDIIFVNNGKGGWYAECAELNPAFCVGLTADLALTEHITVRCSPTLHFVSRQITLTNELDGNKRSQSLKSNYVEVPLSLKVATHRVNNYRPYLLLGAQMAFDMAKDKEQPIVFGRMDAGIHVALGCDTYLPFFKFCPELRFNLGLLDMVEHDRKGVKDETLLQYSDAIHSARNKSISLIFYFE